MRLALPLALSIATAAPLIAQRPAPPRPAVARTPLIVAAADAALRREARISEDSARTVALARVTGGRVTRTELEREGGRLIYSFDIAVAGRDGIEEVHVSAINGRVLAQEHESSATVPAEQKREAAPRPPAPAPARTPRP